jgi:hypothetical protein
MVRAPKSSHPTQIFPPRHSKSSLLNKPLYKYLTLTEIIHLAFPIDSEVRYSTMDETKPTPSADQSASSELRPAEQETHLATNPKGNETTEAPKTETKEGASTIPSSIGELASNAASSASATANTVKDNVFSMFGGGPKKVQKEEEEVDEPSGSSKAKKEGGDEVSLFLNFQLSHKSMQANKLDSGGPRA